MAAACARRVKAHKQHITRGRRTSHPKRRTHTVAGGKRATKRAVKGKRTKPKTSEGEKRSSTTRGGCTRKGKAGATQTAGKRTGTMRGRTVAKAERNAKAKKVTRTGVKMARGKVPRGAITIKQTRRVVKPKLSKQTRRVVKPKPSKQTRRVVKPKLSKQTRRVVKPKLSKQTRRAVKPRASKRVRRTTEVVNEVYTYPYEGMMTLDGGAAIPLSPTMHSEILCNEEHTTFLSMCVSNTEAQSEECTQSISDSVCAQQGSRRRTTVVRKSSPQRSMKSPPVTLRGRRAFMGRKKSIKASPTCTGKSSLAQHEDTHTLFPTAASGEEEEGATKTSVVEKEGKGNGRTTTCAHTSKDCGSYSLRWYQLGAPLLATRVRELFSRPLFNCHFNTESVLDTTATSSGSNNKSKSGVSYSLLYSTFMDEASSSAAAKLLPMPPTSGLSHADKEALSWLFPAIHNGEWFSTPWQFIDHCRSVPHKLLCEDAPLFPLASSHGWGDDPTARRLDTEIRSTYTHLNHENGDLREKDKRQQQKQDPLKDYYWWFMHIHTALLRYGLQEWFPPSSSECKQESLDLQDMGALWGGCRIFQTVVASALARRLTATSSSFFLASSYLTVEWDLLDEAVPVITRIVRDVYVGVINNPEQALLSCYVEDDIDWYSAPAPIGIGRTLLGRNTPFAVHASKEYILSRCEVETLDAFAIYLAKTVLDVRERLRGVAAPVAITADNDKKDHDSLKSGYPRSSRSPSSAPVEKTIEHSSSHLHANVLHCVSNGSVEDRTMALVIWLYLSNAAKHVDDTPIYTQYRCALGV